MGSCYQPGLSMNDGSPRTVSHPSWPSKLRGVDLLPLRDFHPWAGPHVEGTPPALAGAVCDRSGLAPYSPGMDWMLASLLACASLSAPAAPVPSASAPPQPVVVGEGPVSPPVECARQAVRLLAGDRKGAVQLCGGGAGGPERIACAEVALRTLPGRFEDVAAVCADGGNAATGQCVVEAARWQVGKFGLIVSLCSHGADARAVQCARESLAVVNNDLDLATELCRRERGPTPAR